MLANQGCILFVNDSEIDGYECRFDLSEESVKIPSIYLGENGIKYVKSINENNGAATNNLKEIQFPNTVNIIRDRAFMNCSNLTSISIPESVTTIETYAFYGCSNLKKVNITSLESWLNMSVIGDFANPIYYTRSLFVNDKEIKEVKIPSAITTIRNSAFAYCESLTSVQIEDGVINIGDYAFDNCSNLTDVSMPNSIANIGKSSFGDCSNLSNIVLPTGLNSIGQHAFSHCDKLTSINIPNSVKSIGSWAFSNCQNLTNVSLSENLGILNEYTFYRCEKLTSIVIPAKVTTIGKYAFDTCDLTYIIISNNVTDIDASAFHQCFSLEKIYYTGSETEWNSINIDKSTLGAAIDNLSNAKKYYYTDIEPAESDKYWHYDTDGVTPLIWGSTTTE